jgi:hypothetical protein
MQREPGRKKHKGKAPVGYCEGFQSQGFINNQDLYHRSTEPQPWSNNACVYGNAASSR